MLFGFLSDFLVVAGGLGVLGICSGEPGGLLRFEPTTAGVATDWLRLLGSFAAFLAPTGPFARVAGALLVCVAADMVLGYVVKVKREESTVLQFFL